MTPPMRLRSKRLPITNAPRYDADAPSAVKISENPKTNAMVARSTRLRCSRRSAGRRSQSDTTETNEIYPGMSGTTQGEKNPSIPAANATVRFTLTTSLLRPRLPAGQVLNRGDEFVLVRRPVARLEQTSIPVDDRPVRLIGETVFSGHGPVPVVPVGEGQVVPVTPSLWNGVWDSCGALITNSLRVTVPTTFLARGPRALHTRGSCVAKTILLSCGVPSHGCCSALPSQSRQRPTGAFRCLGIGQTRMRARPFPGTEAGEKGSQQRVRENRPPCSGRPRHCRDRPATYAEHGVDEQTWPSP